MKHFTLISFLLLFETISNGQVNRFSKIDFEPHEYHSTYVSPDFDLMMRMGATLQARIDNNRAYRDKLVEWIFDLRSKTTDTDFLNAMNVQYQNLRYLDNDDFAKSDNRLDNIKYSIKEEIEKLNTRQRELPKKLWESALEKLQNNNFNGAISDFSQLNELTPDFMGAYLYKGYALYKIGNFSAALSDLNKFINSVNDEPFAFSTRGWLKYYSKDLIGAMSDFNRQIELEPNSEIAYYNRGSAKSELGDANGAISDYTKAINLKSDFSMAYNNRGWAKFKQKKYSDALIDLNKSIQFDNENWVAFDSRQEIKFAMNDLKGCIEDCNMAILKNAKCDNSYFFRGRANYKQGDKTKACEDWSKAGELSKSEAYEYISKYCK